MSEPRLRGDSIPLSRNVSEGLELRHTARTILRTSVTKRWYFGLADRITQSRQLRRSWPASGRPVDLSEARPSYSRAEAWNPCRDRGARTPTSCHQVGQSSPEAEQANDKSPDSVLERDSVHGNAVASKNKANTLTINSRVCILK